MRKNRREFFPFALVLAVIAGLGACGKATPKFDGAYGVCTLPPDQASSLMSKVATFGMNVVVDTAFSDAQRKAITAAVAVWNDFGKSHGASSLFIMTDGAVPDSFKNADKSNCGPGDDHTFYMVHVADSGRWQSLGNTVYTPGATLRCSQDNVLTNQIIYIEDQVLDPTQYQSVALHELGHAFGLDHSCDKDHDSPDFIGCSKISSNHPYHQAVMFPSLQLKGDNGSPAEVKNELRDNDKARALCEYQ